MNGYSVARIKLKRMKRSRNKFLLFFSYSLTINNIQLHFKKLIDEIYYHKGYGITIFFL